MKTRQLGYSDLGLTTVGLGTWAMGGPWQLGWGPQDDGEAITAILRALEMGINWIDAPLHRTSNSVPKTSRRLSGFCLSARKK